jgi:hypothetical protein
LNIPDYPNAVQVNDIRRLSPIVQFSKVLPTEPPLPLQWTGKLKYFRKVVLFVITPQFRDVIASTGCQFHIDSALGECARQLINRLNNPPQSKIELVYELKNFQEF